MYTIANANVVFPNGIEKKNVRFQGDTIVEISPAGGEGDLNADGLYLSAGFVDIHTHGGYGHDFMDGSTAAFDGVLRFHLEHGTTSVVATSVTSPVKDLVRFLELCRAYRAEKQPYARLIGAHLEGPFLSVRNKGAQKEEYLLSPDRDDYSFMEAYRDVVKTVTISPELSGAAEMTKRLKEAGITVCGGHDDGIYPEFMPSVFAGLSHLTHIYCAMSELRFKDGVRGVGLREYGLTDDNLTAEMIADNKHIPPELARMIVKSKGADKTCVVSDSLRCAGLENDGRVYKLGRIDDETAQLVKVGDGVAVLADGSRFAGSITPVGQMIKNLIKAGISVCDAFRMGTQTPAKIVGENSIGEIAVGKRADACLLDRDFQPVQVFVGGECKYKEKL